MVKLKQIFYSILNKRQVFVRLLVVWLLGLFVFKYDEQNGFDLRFRLRSSQPVDQSIVLVNLSKTGWDRATNPAFTSMLRSARPLSDSYFWSTKVWQDIFTRILSDSPSVISVDLFFDRSVPMSRLQEQSFKQLPKVIWRAEIDDRLRIRVPRFAINYLERSRSSERSLANAALGYVFKGYDNIARRYFQAINIRRLEDLPAKVASSHRYGSMTYLPQKLKPFINYRGPSGTYPTVSLDEVLTPGALPDDFFKNKIVIIGSDSMESHFVKTPVGFLKRSEYQANLVDNILNNLWIKSFSTYVYVLYLFLISVICFLILHNFRQGLAISSLVFFTTSVVSFSIILFDLYNIWVPIFSAVATIVLSYIILINHLLSESEYAEWKAVKKEEASREMNELKNNFVSLFSHDLKTPLAKIHAISDKIMQDKNRSDSFVSDEVKKIQKETRELDRYIQSILQVTRIEAGEFNLNLIPQDINELIKDCIDTLKPLADEKNIEIEFLEEPLFSIELDAKLIKEVFINIIDNSIKYCPEGSKITIKSSDSEENVHITFSDNGPGVSEREQAAVFEKFYRSQNNSMNKKGTGLGLYLVRYFIEIHDGEVELVSAQGEGTTFSISLPYEQKKESEI